MTEVGGGLGLGLGLGSGKVGSRQYSGGIVLHAIFECVSVSVKERERERGGRVRLRIDKDDNACVGTCCDGITAYLLITL